MTRPKRKISPDKYDKILEVASAVFLFILLVLPLYYYPTLPDVIPNHFNASGEPDGYGSKISIWFMPIIGLVIYITMIFLNRYPHVFNYTIEITESNAAYQYRQATKLIRILNLLVTGLFSYIVYNMIQSAQNGSGGLGTWFMPCVIVGSLAPIVWYLIKASK